MSLAQEQAAAATYIRSWMQGIIIYLYLSFYKLSLHYRVQHKDMQILLKPDSVCLRNFQWEIDHRTGIVGILIAACFCGRIYLAENGCSNFFLCMMFMMFLPERWDSYVMTLNLQQSKRRQHSLFNERLFGCIFFLKALHWLSTLVTYLDKGHHKLNVVR